MKNVDYKLDYLEKTNTKIIHTNNNYSSNNKNKSTQENYLNKRNTKIE